MPVPARPMKITCKSCGCSMVIPPQGDVIMRPGQCDRCGSTNLILAVAGPLDRLKLSMASFFQLVLSL